MKAETTRRTFIGTAAATGAAAALPAAAEAKKKSRHRAPSARRADVIVVGAGLAGLNAARQVVAKGRSAYVVEARDRVGGRTLNADLGGGKVVERGGQWVGPTQDRLFALASELGIGTFKTYNDGNGVLVYKGTKQTFSTTGPLGPIPPVPDGLVDAELLIQRLDQMATEIDTKAPWKAAKAAEYDSQTFETWKQANTTTEGGRYLTDLAFTSVFAAEPRDVSLLFTLFYIAAAGNASNVGTFDRLINTAGGAQESRFVGGSQLVSIRMAAQLSKRVVLRAPVRRIVTSPGGVTVTTDRGTFRGKQVIVAIPPSLAGRIDYQPLLPASRDQLTQRMPMGTVIKVEAVYDKPFWRDDGLAGYTNADTDPVRLTYDNSPPDGSPGVLLGFIEGHAGRVWGRRSPADRRAAVLDNFATFYGEKARNPTRYIETLWADEEWSRGCYGAYTPPGVLLDFGEYLRAPVGRIKWAGTETADYWVGYMDGALRSGERAAAEALGDL
ncbi:MAG TPA: flavin monoamine oxidase family protein [Solirubrobacteraceae bacterium]